MRAALVTVLATVVLTACAPGTDLGPVGPIDVDVDTPALRAQKKAARVEPCVQPETAKTDNGLPDITLPCLGGGPDVDLARLRGPMVVTFWASWCGPCRRELPIFERFAQKYDGQVAVLGIDFKDLRPAAALELVAASKATFPLLADAPADLEVPLRVTYLPTLAFLDADGTLTSWGGDARTKALEIESLEELEGLVAEHLGADVLTPATPAPRKKARR